MREIFVFGSNTEGRHGKGAALTAKLKYGAIHGQARGRQGDAYAIVTKDLTKPYGQRNRSVSLINIHVEVLDFIEYAKINPEEQFIVSPIGCGLAGYTPEEIAPMFKDSPPNVILPEEFVQIISQNNKQ